MKNELKHQIKTINSNLDRLLRSHQAATKENLLLKTQIETLRRQVTEKNQELQKTTQELELLKTVKAIKEVETTGAELTQEQKEVRNKINSYIREIDSCIRKLQH